MKVVHTEFHLDPEVHNRVVKMLTDYCSMQMHVAVSLRHSSDEEQKKQVNDQLALLLMLRSKFNVGSKEIEVKEPVDSRPGCSCTTTCEGYITEGQRCKELPL